MSFPSLLMLKPYIQLLRAPQYIKNLVIFLPAFFALRVTEPDTFWRTFLAVIGFSIVASSVYILNDYLDQEEDRQHPVKRHRPIASGAVPGHHALIMMVVLVLIGISTFLFLSRNAFYLVSAYVFLNVAYSLRLKHIPIIDIFIIALGFLIRIATGGQVAQEPIPLTMWIALIIMLGALFLGLAKRRDDVILAAGGAQVRKNIDGYNLEFINGAMMIIASMLLVSYLFYTISPEVQQRHDSQYLYFTVMFVLLGVLRYLQITFVEEKSGNPTKVFLTDVFLQLIILGWIGTFVYLIYIP